MGQVDLHVHSTKSDGTYTPTELVNYAVEKGLTAFALTDHDTIDGIEEALEAAKNKPITVIPGIEYSTEYLNRDVHIVGLFIDYKAPVFLEYLSRFQQSRTDRNYKLCANLRNANIDITYEALLEMFPDAVITRAHYAKYLLTKGYVKSMKEAFERYVGDHCKAFVPREKITPAQAVSLIMPIPVKGVTFRVFAVGDMANPVRIKILTPIASGIFAAHKKRGRIKHVRPITRTVIEESGIPGLTERLRETRRARLIIAIF